jgi:Transglutaminase-like enzymes, putative cysteine proteases
MKFGENTTYKTFTSGINVSQECIITQDYYTDDEKGNVISSIILLLAGTYGFMGTLLADFKMNDYRGIIYPLVGVLCLMWGAVFYFQDYIKQIMSVILVLFIGFMALSYTRLSIGYNKAFNIMIDYINQQYNQNFMSPINFFGQEYIAELVLFFATITFLVCWILSVWILYRPRASFVFLLYAPLLFIEAIVGIVPNPVCLGLIFVAIIGTFIRSSTVGAFQKTINIQVLFGYSQHNYLRKNELYQQGIQLKAIMYQGGLLLLSMILLFILTMFPVNAIFKANQNELRNKIQYNVLGNAIQNWAVSDKNPFSLLFAKNGIGGIGDGNLGKVGSIEYSGKLDLIVESSKEVDNTLYLKAFIGGEYGKNKWNPYTAEEEYLKRHNLDESIFVNKESQNLSAVAVNLFPEIQSISSMGFQPWNEINVFNISANHKYIYNPYFSIKNLDKGYNSFIALDLPDYLGLNELQRYVLLNLGNEEFTWYENDILPEYLQLPEVGLERLKQQCKDVGYYGMEYLDEISSYIINTLHSNTTYSLSPGILPSGKDFAEYFLYEQKEGYCTHYATTATLMYRMFGIPARFVMGYSVPSVTFYERKTSLIDSKMVAEVNAERAHAWTEIYLKGVGWVPVEVTPEDMEDAMNKMMESFEERNNDTQNNNEIERETRLKNERLLKMVSYISTVLAAACIIILFVWRIRLYRKKYKKPSMDLPNEGIKQVYINLYKIFVFAGFKENEADVTALMPIFVKEKFPVINEEEFLYFMDLVLQANYSNHEMTGEDVEKSEQLYNECRIYITRQMIWIKKIKFNIQCPQPK